ncbi:MAG: pilus assembly FimT family protein [Fibrobacterota bacterium]
MISTDARFSPPPKGLTILELMVVISISAIVLTLVFTSWNYLNKHVSHQESRALFRDEAVRILDQIAIKLRKTSGVLEMTHSSVKLLEREGSDTLEYLFDGERLLKNGSPVQFREREGKITSFELENINETGSRQMLLQLTLCSRDAADSYDTVSVLVQSKSADSDIADSDWDF